MFKKRVAKSNSIRLKKEKTIDAIDEIDDVSSDSISFKIAEQKLRKSYVNACVSYVNVFHLLIENHYLIVILPIIMHVI